MTSLTGMKTDLSVNFLLLEFASLGNVFCASALFYFILISNNQSCKQCCCFFQKTWNLKLHLPFLLAFNIFSQVTGSAYGCLTSGFLLFCKNRSTLQRNLKYTSEKVEVIDSFNIWKPLRITTGKCF